MKKIKEKGFAVMFEHPLGWTLISVEMHRCIAERRVQEWRKKDNYWKYKVVPCEILIAKNPKK